MIRIHRHTQTNIENIQKDLRSFTVRKIRNTCLIKSRWTCSFGKTASFLLHLFPGKHRCFNRLKYNAQNCKYTISCVTIYALYSIHVVFGFSMWHTHHLNRSRETKHTNALNDLLEEKKAWEKEKIICWKLRWHFMLHYNISEFDEQKRSTEMSRSCVWFRCCWTNQIKPFLSIHEYAKCCLFRSHSIIRVHADIENDRDRKIFQINWRMKNDTKTTNSIWKLLHKNIFEEKKIASKTTRTFVIGCLSSVFIFCFFVCSFLPAAIF